MGLETRRWQGFLETNLRNAEVQEFPVVPTFYYGVK